MRSLVVDDSPAVRARLCALLREAGITVVAEACEGEEALRLVRRHAPDAVVLDLQMPAMDGFKVLRELRKVPSPPRVVVLTNLTLESYRLECLRLGADAFLDKSKDFELVAAAVFGRATQKS
jgi:two-component system response regulator EvgA